ncbi:MAG TPA: phospholipase D-like domain-containing protein [Bacteriovoracaceae bacterium]|nr:phospholipase D-like domain-containing protein [Bacteriovoracaceae bacterium]
MKSPGKRIEHEIRSIGSIDSPQVIRSIGELLGPPLISGNTVTSLHNGDEIFPAMLGAIQSAQKSITFETFIYWSGEIGKKFAKALSERARSGVRVHVLLDWIGSRTFEDEAIEVMKKSGVQVMRYRPLRWYNISRVNNRTHRKILVVDGLIGFTGGVGIADQWLGSAQDKEHWRDSHFKINGPVVGQLQAAFMDNWNATHPEVLHGENYFPEIPDCGNVLSQVFKSSPEEGSGSVRLMYLYSIAHAQKTIRIASAYFVPDVHVRKLLIDAAKRGVQIEVIVPGRKIDTALTRRASRAVWGDMLKAGIRINEYEVTMFHCKYMIVDNVWVSVGSTNMDNRSFRLNDECNLNAMDPLWAEHMVETFKRDKSLSNEVTWEIWNQRPWKDKIIEQAARIFRSQV